MSYHAASWAPMPYAETVHYKCGFGQDASCDSANEGVAGANAARSQDWSGVAHGGSMLLVVPDSGETYSGVQSCDVASYNEGYLGAWQYRCSANSGTMTETSGGYDCQVPGGTSPSPSPAPSPGGTPSPTPAPSSGDSDQTQAQTAAVPLAVAGALALGIILWKVFT